MDNSILVSIVLGVTVGVGTVLFVGIPLLQKKGVKVNELLQKVDVVLDGVDKAVDAAKVIAPVNPILIVLDKIEQLAHLGVNQAQQLYEASQLPKDDRNSKAKEVIYAALKPLNIEVTPEIYKIIDGAIETEVLVLGHKDKTEVEQIEDKQQLQSQLQEKNQENEQLKQKLFEIKNTVGII